MPKQPPIGIICGSGMGSLKSLENRKEFEVQTPFGKPSAALITGEINGVSVVVLRRHGKGHTTLPSEINVQANVAALKMQGVKQVLSFSAVGSLDIAAPPGTFVIVDQYIDRTYARKKTYFGNGIVGHVAFGTPVCEDSSRLLSRAATAINLSYLERGTYVVMEGPQFSTRAESAFHRSLGGTVIGMTAMPEPKLFREAEICYNMVAMVTDFDCWHDDHDQVTAELVSERMQHNSINAEKLLAGVLQSFSARPSLCPCGCNTALDGAIMTDLDMIPAQKKTELSFLLDRFLTASHGETKGDNA